MDFSLTGAGKGRLPTLRKRPRKRKTFDEMTVYGRRRGIQDLKKLFKEKEEQYQAPVSRLAGFVIQQVSKPANFTKRKDSGKAYYYFIIQEEYFKNRRLSNLGSAISDGVATSTIRLPVDQALYLQTYGKMGKTGYTTLRLAVLPYGLVFPPYDETSKYKHQNIVPKQLVSSKWLKVVLHRSDWFKIVLECWYHQVSAFKVLLYFS